ncbi:hypothetical protein BDV25DRAFT_144477 [Aspergillus avenaceus]|uniref:Uncharacterized protein n=1 Tax=Aspergillus avenaceus TaxID=36643 RepID=A0A5N6TH18_ASPAV|nr:hypothetical protein BDV25DRAFT_144477 [Aspergillus avenaceus]
MKTPISILVLVLTLLNITHALQARGDPPLLEPPIDAPAGPGNPTNRFKLDLSEPIKEVTAHGKCRRDRKLPEGWCYIRNDSKHNNHLYLVFKNGFTAYGPSCLRDSRVSWFREFASFVEY